MAFFIVIYSFCSTSCQKFVPLLSTAPCILKQVSYQELDANGTRTIQDPKCLGLPREILELVYAFPLGFRDRAHMIVDFAQYIPSRDRAIELANLCYKHITWM